MSALVYRCWLIAAVIAAYVWLQQPMLHQFSLQIFCTSLVIYFVIKRLNRASFWHFAPSILSIEMPLVIFAFLLVVGFTGATNSPFYPLTFVLLFFLVFAADSLTSILITLLITLFYYSLGFQASTNVIAHLVSLPLMLGFFLFARDQYTQANREKDLLKNQESALANSQYAEASMETFLIEYLNPQLEQLKRLLNFPQQNQKVMLHQITSLQVEIQKRARPSRAVSDANQAIVDTVSDPIAELEVTQSTAIISESDMTQSDTPPV